MKRIIFLIIIASYLLPTCYAQVSHGGEPLPLISTRSSNNQWYKEMPSFDLTEQLRIDSISSNDLRSGYRFAYKFITDYNRYNSGITFTQPDGTKVWRLGIRSSGALSINVLFTEYELPEGARLFLYNPEQTHILGAFNHLNNSELGILPVSPVYGDELIIEYQEPAHVSFPGKLTIGEVNHAYRYLRGREPGEDQSRFFCMEPLACFPSDSVITEELGRSVVLLMINGDVACSGVMINNTANNGKPYLLTASHCLNNNFVITDPEQYAVMAGSVVCFFNYNSPLCSPVINGTEEMSISSAKYLALNEAHDMALLELLETPPIYYQPYYAGWDLSEELTPPFFGIHHPSGSVKRVNWLDEEIELTTYNLPGIPFSDDAHWYIRKWTAGSTYGGSSGSPLFNINGSIIGGLSGGSSTCNYPVKDYYFALSRAWEPEEGKDRQLKYWLNPTDKNYSSIGGLDPYKSSGSSIRLSNVRANGNVDEVETTTLSSTEPIPVFSNNSLGTTEFVDMYYSEKQGKVYGTYIVTPSVDTDYQNLKIEINVYDGTNGPKTLLHTETFRPAFTHYNKNKGAFADSIKTLKRAQESFISFSKPVDVKGQFYIGYKIVSSPDNVYFTAYNLPKGKTTFNTTWLLYKNSWIEAGSHPVNPLKTSLFIDPVIQYTTTVDSAHIDTEKQAYIFIGADRKTIHILLPDDTETAQFSLIDMNGKIIETYSITEKQTTLSVPVSSSGIYIGKLTHGYKQFIQKLIF